MKTKTTITKTNHKPYKDYELKANRYKFYKGRYIITFYDKDDEFMLHMFDSVKDILKFQGKEITKQNVQRLNILLYIALKNPNTVTKILDGEPMRIHIIDILDEN